MAGSCAPVTLDGGIPGTVHPAASAVRKDPPRQLPDSQAFADLEQFIHA